MTQSKSNVTALGCLVVALPAATACGKVTSPVIPVDPNSATFLIEPAMVENALFQRQLRGTLCLTQSVVVARFWLSGFRTCSFGNAAQAGGVILPPFQEEGRPDTDSSHHGLSVVKGEACSHFSFVVLVVITLITLLHYMNYCVITALPRDIIKLLH